MSLETTLNEVLKKAQGAGALGSKLKFDFGGDGAIHLDGTGASNVVSTENKDADCTINISLDDFNALLEGSLNPMTAFMTGKIKVKGDMGVAMKLQSLFS